MQIETELKLFKARIDPKISAYFDAIRDDTLREDELMGEALGYAKTLILAGGKRLRAALMYYGYLGAGGTEKEKILDTSVSVELIHAFLLVHDDIMDRDDVRHGVPTLHRRYAELGRTAFPDMDTEHFGMSIAIIMGDLLCAFGNDIIFHSQFPVDLVFEALTKVQHIVAQTTIGQARDIYMEYKRKASEEEILQMYTNKTARYTVEWPLHMGAILAGGSKEVLAAYSAYAIPLGIAFQIQDDILGIFGDKDRLGKPIGSDIQEGKITLLVSHAQNRGSGKQSSRINELLSRGKKLTEPEIEEFRTIIKDTGALDSAKERAARYIEDGKRALESSRVHIQPEAYEFLVGVANYMAERQY